MKTSPLIAAALVAALLSMGPLAPMTDPGAESAAGAAGATPVPPIEPPLTGQAPGQETATGPKSFESMMIPAERPGHEQ